MRGFAHDGLADAERANCCKHFLLVMLLVYRLFLASWSANLFFLMKLNEIKYDNVLQGERRGWMALLHASVEEEGDSPPS